MIDLIFDAVNLLIFVGLVAYGISRLIPSLRVLIEQEKKIERDLHEEHQQLALAQKHIENDLVAQEAGCTNLYGKINQWKTVVAGQMTQSEAEQLHFQERAEKKILVQSQQHTLRGVYEQVTPRVVQILEKELREHFANEKAAHAAIESIIKELKK